MEILQVQAFLAVAEELHFSRAAQKLHMAQPPLSRIIKQLEKEMGAVLFDRHTRSVRLTPAGEALVEPAQKILNACRMAELAVASAGQGKTGRVRLGFSGTSSHLLVGKWAKLVRKTNPGLEFVINSNAFAEEGLRRVTDGSLDAAMVRWISPPPGITSRVVLNEQLLVALPRDHRLATKKVLTMRELAHESWVLFPADPGSALREVVIRSAQDADFSPHIAQTAPDSLSLIALVSAEAGITVTVSTVAQTVRNPDVVFIPLDGPITSLDVRIAWREDNHSPALMEVLRLSEQALPTPK